MDIGHAMQWRPKTDCVAARTFSKENVQEARPKQQHRAYVA